MPTEIFAPEIDYENKVLNASTSIYRSISPQASGDVNLSASSSVGPTEFIIPASVWNPSKSRLNFTFTHSAVAAKSSWINANALTMINRIVCYDVSTNAIMLDCSNFNQYASLTSTVGTHLTQFLTKGYSTGNPNVTAVSGAQDTQEDINKVNTIANLTVAMDATVADVGPENLYLGRRQKYISTVNNDVFLSLSIPFSAFKFTALALNRQLYNPSNMVIQIYWNSTDTFLFQSDAINALTNPTSLPTVSAPKITGMSVSLCNEGNLLIVGQVIETVMKRGLSMPIAYPTTTRQTIASSTQHNYQLQLTRGYGQRILAIISAPFANAVAGVAGSVLTTQNIHGKGNLNNYNTFINNVALKYPNGFSVLKSEDYYIGNKEQIATSALQTFGTYQTCEWLHSDKFNGDAPLCEMDQTVISGLDVSNQSSTWQMNATVTPAVDYTWATVIIGQKVLTLNNSGSVVV